MESNLKINKRSEQTTATYTKGDYRVEITYNVNKGDGTIENISMSFYGSNGNYFGGVNANTNGTNELAYNISGVHQNKLSEVASLVEEISSAITTNVASDVE
uniref:Uncharacterized protein n=1 Tax=Geladintestivirus 4 TaxID=3233136 RepID=A0AAU8MHF0_9CAUD